MNVGGRPRNSVFRGRLLLVVGWVSIAGAIALGLIVSRDDQTDTVVLDVEHAVAADPPATVPPIDTSPADRSTAPTTTSVTTDSDTPRDTPGDTTVTDTTTPPSARDEPATSPPPSTMPLSPLAELIGRPGSAVPIPVEPRARPVAMAIPATDLWAPVRGVGLEDDGQLEVPDETEVGWYRYGATPGRPGATVLAAHVTWNGTIGPFFRLGDLEPGARVEVRLDDDSLRVYEVVERTMYDKDALPRDRIWRNSGDESLVLITCGGSFNPEIRRYRQNIVVYAVPVAVG